jgi:hypothetical protein
MAKDNMPEEPLEGEAEGMRTFPSSCRTVLADVRSLFLTKMVQIRAFWEEE